METSDEVVSEDVAQVNVGMENVSVEILNEGVAVLPLSYALLLPLLDDGDWLLPSQGVMVLKAHHLLSPLRVGRVNADQDLAAIK